MTTPEECPVCGSMLWVDPWDTHPDVECALRAELRDVKAERDALRRLPVIRTCEDCAWGTVCSVPGTRRCYHPTQLSEAPQVTGAPPEWCPLRGGAR